MNYKLWLLTMCFALPIGLGLDLLEKIAYPNQIPIPERIFGFLVGACIWFACKKIVSKLLI